MKAYMSVPGVRAVCCIGPVRDSQHAEAEARVLLSTTEPDRDAEGWFTAHVPANFPEHGMHALAEALAAFCDDGHGC